MKPPSIVVDTAWKLAVWEATAAKSPFIEKEHAVIGLLSLGKVAAGKPDDMKLDREEWNSVRAEWAAQHGITLEIDDTVKEILTDKGYNPEYGARELRRVVERELEMKLAEKLLHHDKEAGIAWKAVKEKQGVLIEI
jgi:ATP-dependent Clp protease ATP-binding subunit ClpA